MKNQQSGFTLIELIMVIVILGILAAVALPKFADFSGEARFASLNGALGAVRSASAIVHSAALVNDETGEKGSVTLEGQPIELAYGYATKDSIMDAAQLSSEFTTNDPSGTVKLGACNFTYKEAAEGGAAEISDVKDAVDDKRC
ncbi:pilin [Marinobacter sp. LV10MA510-1]|uniref:pilin n=1 Tax=Marinobacter sp. LV10MA510-1 TaxID=1415567 RepID=UPI000BF8F5F3|nr:prepilin-type N-terminal cleavage/methylation domain-containing protein [Marinobacter sp. LV10MA510-1]PFG10188.1 MSHA pilin protein MshA [Marinobacter sp. LV10MA510-1]